MRGIYTQSQFESKVAHSNFLENLNFAPQSDDLCSTFLKGHLMVEEALYTVVESSCIDKKMFSKAKLSFSQLFHLACALNKIPKLTKSFKAIYLLDSIRSNLVRNLEPDSLNKEVQQLFELCTPTENDCSEKFATPSRQISYCIGYLLGVLEAFKQPTE